MTPALPPVAVQKPRRDTDDGEHHHHQDGGGEQREHRHQIKSRVLGNLG